MGTLGGRRGGEGQGQLVDTPPPALTSQLSQAGPQGSSQVTSWWPLQQRWAVSAVWRMRRGGEPWCSLLGVQPGVGWGMRSREGDGQAEPGMQDPPAGLSSCPGCACISTAHTSLHHPGALGSTVLSGQGCLPSLPGLRGRFLCFLPLQEPSLSVQREQGPEMTHHFPRPHIPICRMGCDDPPEGCQETGIKG